MGRETVGTAARRDSQQGRYRVVQRRCDAIQLTTHPQRPQSSADQWQSGEPAASASLPLPLASACPLDLLVVGEEEQRPRRLITSQHAESIGGVSDGLGPHSGEADDRWDPAEAANRCIAPAGRRESNEKTHEEEWAQKLNLIDRPNPRYCACWLLLIPRTSRPISTRCQLGRRIQGSERQAHSRASCANRFRPPSLPRQISSQSYSRQQIEQVAHLQLSISRPLRLSRFLPSTSPP